jgi:hypothetical protein
MTGQMYAPLLALILGAATPPGPPPEAVRGWSARPFSIPPGELLALAARARGQLLKKGEPLPGELTLWKSVEYEVNGDLVLTRSHVVKVPLTEEGAKWAGRVWPKGESELTAKQRLDLRIVTREGKSKTVTSEAIDKLNALRAEGTPVGLLDVKPGSIVEQVSMHQDKRPLVAGGASAYTVLQGYVWAARVRVVAPATSPLRGAVHGVAGVHERRAALGERTEIEWTAGPQLYGRSAALAEITERVPSIAWTTWRSWQDISARLAEAIEPRIKPAEAAAVAKQAAGDAATPPEVAARLFSVVTQAVKYAEVSFGSRGLVPSPTADILKAGSADSRDMAALLVAAARARGLQADLALGQWLFRMTEELPTVDNLDSMLVMVSGPGLKTPLWMDVSNSRKLNQLSEGLLGESALPVRRKGSPLVPLPTSNPSQ